MPASALRSNDFESATTAETLWHVALTQDGSSLVIRAMEIDEFQRRLQPQPLIVEGGRLVGSNNGEWLGDVWWEGSNGEREQIADMINPIGFVASGATVLCVEGLSHLGREHGSLLQLSRGPDAKWEMTKRFDFDAAPWVYVTRHDGTLLVALSNALISVDGARGVAVVHRNEYWRWMLPTSIVEDREGRLYIGARHGVVKLTPQESGFEEEWLMPPE